MPHFPPQLSAQVARSHGVVSAENLIRAGYTANTIRSQVRGGALIRVHDGVFRVATSPDTFEARCVAACAADPEALVSGPAAARLWEFRHVFQPDVPYVLFSHDRTPLARGVLIRRTNVLSAGDVVTRDDGIRVACPPRAWFDCARDLTDEGFEMLTEWVLDHHASLSTLARTVERLDARGRPGLARVHRVMSRRVDWQRPADSGLELRVLSALERRGIGPIIRQFRLQLADGAAIHLDGAVPSVRWGVEVDHVTWHGGRVEAQRDKSRDRRARRVGWQIDRVTDQELAADFAGAIDELVALHRIRTDEVRAA